MAPLSPVYRLLLVFFLLISPLVQAQNNGFDPNEEQRGVHLEMDDIGRLLLGFRNKAYEDISDELFDRISTYDIGVPLGDYSTLIGQVRRKVYDNNDGTYTVLDVFGVKGIVAPGTSLDVAGVPLYAAIGAENGYDFINIRQYDNKLKIGYAPAVMLPDDPWYWDLWHGARAQWFGAKYIYDMVNGTFNTAFNFFRSPSDEFSARYQNIFNIIRTPFHLPLGVHEFSRMEPGEIVSYTITGGIFLPVGVGWEHPVFASNIGLNLYKRGAVRVTILKERNGDFAKIRLSNLSTQGYSIGGKVKGKIDLVEGIFFGSNLSASIVPFKIEVGSANLKMFDETYHYDMRTQEGVGAYEKAVLGDFTTSQKLYDKETTTHQDSFDLNYNLIVWRHQKSFQLDNSVITLRDEDGVNHVFKSMSHNEIKTGNVFYGRDESMDYFVDTTLEMDDPVNVQESKNPVVQIAFFVTDRHAYGYQLRQYFKVIENILQDPQFFDEGRYDIDKDYEKMSLQFEVRFYLEAINQILNAPEDELWQALAKAFGLDPAEWESAQKRKQWVSQMTYVASFFRVRRSIEKISVMNEAQKIVTYFKKIKEEPNRKLRAVLLSKLHHESAFQWRMLTVMLLLAHKENIYYELHVKGKNVPDIDRSWGTPLEIQRPDLHENDEKEMDGRPVITRAHLSDLELSYPPEDSHPPEDAQTRLQFKTDVDPQTIEGFYFKINHIRGWWFRNEKLYETPNEQELFKEFIFNEDGMVTVFLDRLSFSQKLEEGQSYELIFAFRQKNKIFSVEAKLIFTFEHKTPMAIQWMNLEGKSEMK